MLRIIFYTLIALLVMSFFGISIQSVIHSPVGQDNFGYVGTLIVSGYHFVANFIGGIVAWFGNLAHGAFN